MSEAVASVQVGRERAELFEDRVRWISGAPGKRSRLVLPASAVTAIETEVTRNLQACVVAAIVAGAVFGFNAFLAVRAGGPLWVMVLLSVGLVALIVLVVYLTSRRASLRVASASDGFELHSGVGDRENLEAFAMDVERACCAPVASSSSSSSAGRAAVTSPER